ncbi:MAG: quinol:cytochrome C oxidoreductase [Planctomycetes bacterium]|nr:quinol:cytochrome C oxidoreductase [Planctomycetota bacterium]
MTHTLARQAPTLGDRASRWGTIALGVGVIALAAAAYFGWAREDGFKRLQHAWLVACAFWLSISLGGLFFVIVQHLTRAGWSVVVRRVAELVAANTLVTAILFAPLVAMVLKGDASLYPWADPHHVAEHPLLAAKAPWLDAKFFALRVVVYFGTWFLIGRWLLKRSTEQDGASGVEPTLALERRAPPAMVAFALTLNFAAFDLLMSVVPTWYSTIFGVYVFAGSVMSFFAFSVVALRFLQKHGLLEREVNVEHYHDLGKFLFAFVFFWSYIAFSQFMLIWYADLPEETFWFKTRMEGPWAIVSVVLLFGHFLLPFAGLLSRHAKRRLGILTFWAVWLLVMQAVDMFWLVMPSVETSANPVTLAGIVSPIDVACLVGAGGIWLFALTKLAGGRALIPVNDPRLPQSLAFENF